MSPSMARPCLHHGCPALVRGVSSYCSAHASEDTYHNSRPTTKQRGYGGKWPKTSARIIRRDGGACQIRLPGCTVTATHADHIVPKAVGGTDADSNLRAACAQCNGRRTGGLRRGQDSTPNGPARPLPWQTDNVHPADDADSGPAIG